MFLKKLGEEQIFFYERKKSERKMLLTKNMSKMFTLNGNHAGSWPKYISDKSKIEILREKNAKEHFVNQIY